MKKIISLIVLAVFVSTGFLISFSSDAEAIPAFARKESAECTLCHVGFPKLNSFGFEYKQRGYRMEGDEGPWLWDYPTMQFAGMSAFGLVWRNTNRAGTANDATETFLTRKELELFSGGTLAPKISYFADLDFEGAGEDEGEGIVHIGRTFIILDDIMPDAMLNIKAGKYNSSLYWLSNNRKLSMEPNSYLASQGGSMPTTNRQGLGFGAASSDGKYQHGIEINGIFPSKTRYQVGVGNDTVATTTLSGTTTNTTNFSLKQFYSIFDQTFDFMGEQRVGFVWVSNRIGTGSNNGSGADTTKRTHLLGGSIDLEIPLGKLMPLNLMYAYFHFDDDETVGTADYNNHIVEGILPINDKIIITARYDDYDLKNRKTGDRRRWLVNGHYYFAPNVDIIASYSNTKTDVSETAKMEMDMFMLMFHIGF